jgi:putative Mg2+ transporter-C (MgtC) family protein
MAINIQMEMILRLLLAAVLGAGIGYQRERAGKPAGLRTHILIAIGSALFTVVSMFGFGGQVDPSRVAAGVVTGIGFIGAGVIFRGMRMDGPVVGLTTAASIWVTAAIGLAAGVGMYLVAVVIAVLAVGVLMLPKVRG